MKYIDAEKLIAEIQKLRSETCISESDDYYEYAKSEIIDIITSLQKEQPEVDLEREIRDYFSKWDYDYYNCVITMGNDIVATLSSIQNVARHFYELGLNARKEE